jgi:hypothetical protein
MAGRVPAIFATTNEARMAGPRPAMTKLKRELRGESFRRNELPPTFQQSLNRMIHGF